jgi:hypothetical protein
MAKLQHRIQPVMIVVQRTFITNCSGSHQLSHTAASPTLLPPPRCVVLGTQHLLVAALCVCAPVDPTVVFI